MLLVKLRLDGDYQRLAFIDNELERLHGVRVDANDQRTRFRAAHAAGKVSDEELKATESKIENTLAKIPELYERAAGIRKNVAELQKLSLKLAAIATPKLAPLAMELTLSLRAELGISGSDDTHKLQMLRFIKDGMDWLHGFLEEADQITSKTIEDCARPPR
jgi:hypothetical protein